MFAEWISLLGSRAAILSGLASWKKATASDHRLIDGRQFLSQWGVVQKERRKRDRARGDWMWDELSESTRSPSGSQSITPRIEHSTSNAASTPRSIFSDVDE
jgi:hypothetical protein